MAGNTRQRWNSPITDRLSAVSSLRYRCASLALGGFFLALGCSHPPGRSATSRAEQTSTLPARTSSDSSIASAADDGQWIMPARNFASTRYSGQNQITADNVAQL